MHYRCQGYWVTVSEQPQLHSDFRADGRYKKFVQQMLDVIELGNHLEKSILTMRFDTPVVPLAVEVNSDDRRIWGVHEYHTMLRPGLSPFIERSVTTDELGYITIHVLRLKRAVMLARAYGGQQIKSLPWMKSAYPDAAVQYWHENAFLARGHYMIKPNTTTPRPPDWYRPANVKN